MDYMLLIYGAENRWTPDERTECMVESRAICDQLAAKGQYLSASPLQSVTTATTVRVRDGRPLVTDGPFAETTEQLGGYYLLRLADLDEAIDVAGKLPPVTKGTVEIRPLLPLDGLPPSRLDRPTEPASTRYLLLCYDDEAAWRQAGEQAQRAAMAEAAAMCRELDDAGRYVFASPLRPAASATCVRVRDGKRIITDGPFAETHEVLGGFYQLAVGSRDEAVRVATRHPGASRGSVEVRPLFDMTGLQNL
jgi:hypothetical protein